MDVITTNTTKGGVTLSHPGEMLVGPFLPGWSNLDPDAGCRLAIMTDQATPLRGAEGELLLIRAFAVTICPAADDWAATTELRILLEDGRVLSSDSPTVLISAIKLMHERGTGIYENPIAARYIPHVVYWGDCLSLVRAYHRPPQTIEQD